MTGDCRLDAPGWDAGDPGRGPRLRATLLAVGSTVALILYFSWLLRPGLRQSDSRSLTWGSENPISRDWRMKRKVSTSEALNRR